MAKMGRPPSADSKRKRITIRLNDETYEKLVKYAADHDVTMTDVALKCIEEFISKQE